MSVVSGRPVVRQRGRGVAVAALLLGTLAISTSYGMVLLLPLYVQRLGGDEADFGAVLSAAAVPAVLVIAWLVRSPQLVRPHLLVGAAAVSFAAATVGAAFVRGTWVPLVGVGLLLGTAWAVVYTAAPMVMTELVDDARRATYFGYLTGTQQVGIGVGPTFAGFLVAWTGYPGAFLAAGVLGLVAAVLMVAVGRRLPRHGPAPAGAGSDQPSLRHAMRGIWRGEAVFALLLIVLFACLFTSLTQFQTTFAATKGLDYSIFYLGYTAAVIVARFGLARLASRAHPWLVTAVSVSVLAAAMSVFPVLGPHPVLYGTAAVLVGLGYGLALPTMQAQAVNTTAPQVRPRVLPLAGLLFQAAILGFPLLAGWLAAGAGYLALFVLLVGLTLWQAAVAWWRYAVARTARRGRREVAAEYT